MIVFRMKDSITFNFYTKPFMWSRDTLKTPLKGTESKNVATCMCVALTHSHTHWELMQNRVSVGARRTIPPLHGGVMRGNKTWGQWLDTGHRPWTFYETFLDLERDLFDRNDVIMTERVVGEVCQRWYIEEGIIGQCRGPWMPFYGWASSLLSLCRTRNKLGRLGT